MIFKTLLGKRSYVGRNSNKEIDSRKDSIKGSKDRNPRIQSDTCQKSQEKADSDSPSVLCVWTLFITLLVRPHNISLVVMELAQIYCLQQVIERFVCRQDGMVVTALFYIWMGQAAFFHQVSKGVILLCSLSSNLVCCFVNFC